MKIYNFRSQSTPEKTYETRLWSEGKMTCNCPGWTRRTQPDGQRLCVHTRLVSAGNAESDPLFVNRYSIPDYIPGFYPTQRQPKEQPKEKPLNPVRKFSFD